MSRKDKIINRTKNNKEYFEQINSYAVKFSPATNYGIVLISVALLGGCVCVSQNVKSKLGWILFSFGFFIFPILFYVIPYIYRKNKFKRYCNDSVNEYSFDSNHLNQKDGDQIIKQFNYDDIISLESYKDLYIISFKYSSPLYLDKNGFNQNSKEINEFLSKRTKIEIKDKNKKKEEKKK